MAIRCLLCTHFARSRIVVDGEYDGVPAQLNKIYMHVFKMKNENKSYIYINKMRQSNTMIITIIN